MADLSTRKIAIVHDWLVTYGGAERVLNGMLECFPQADLFAVVDFIPDDQRDFLLGKRAVTTAIQRWPLARTKYRAYLPLMPLAIEQLDLRDYDLVLSSSHAVAKGVLTGPDQLHISYVHSPIRYAWDLQHQYLKESGLDKGPLSWLARYLLHRLRLWDIRSAFGVDCFLANSQFIARRIRKVYGREAKVIYPPVDVTAFQLRETKEDFYLAASRMVPYKRLDLIVEAFSQMRTRKLVVIGDGPDLPKVKAKAGKNVEILGYQPFEVLRDLMQRARAFVFAAEEDFGIVVVEAQACGTPVIAYGRGGVLETVRGLGYTNGPATGLFFHAQTVEALREAIERFEANIDNFNPKSIRENALRFSAERFRREFSAAVEAAWEAFQANLSTNGGSADSLDAN